MSAKPHEGHGWLQRLVGDWTYEAGAVMAPGQPPVKSARTESVRPLGALPCGSWAKGAASAPAAARRTRC